MRASFIGSLRVTPSNSVRPWSTTSGLSTIWYSSIKPASASCGDDAAAAHHHDIGTGLLLQRADFRPEVALEQRGVVPAGMIERPREHEFRQGVEPPGHDGIAVQRRRRRPEARHQLIGDAAEQ